MLEETTRRSLDGYVMGRRLLAIVAFMLPSLSLYSTTRKQRLSLPVRLGLNASPIPSSLRPPIPDLHKAKIVDRLRRNDFLNSIAIIDSWVLKKLSDAQICEQACGELRPCAESQRKCKNTFWKRTGVPGAFCRLSSWRTRESDGRPDCK